MVKITEKLMTEIFPNNFLDLVAFELRFPVDLTIRNKIPLFQKSLQESFPNYAEGFSVKFPFPADIEKKESTESHLLDYQFKNEQRGLNLILKTFSILGLRTNSYTTYSSYLQLFINILEKFNEVSDITLFKRLGLRYITKIPFLNSLKDSNMLRNKYINPIINVDILNVPAPKSQILDIIYKESEYEIREQIVFRKGPERKKPWEVIIDIDCAFNGNISVKDNFLELKKRMNDLHQLIKEKFFDLITEEFLQILRGVQ